MQTMLRRCRPALVGGMLLAGTTVVAGSPPTIGPQVRVDTVGGTAGANETTASSSDANPLEIVAGWNDYRQSGGVRSGFSLSLDGGESWTGFILRPAPQFQTNVEGDPMTAYDPRTGYLWAGAISFANNGGLYVARKAPGATEFEPAVMAQQAGGVDKGWMAAGPRFNQPNTTRVFAAYNFGVIWSDDLGQTFTSPMSLGAGLGFQPRIGPNGEIYVGYWDWTGSGQGLRIARSLNNGASFSTHTVATRMDVWGTQDGSRVPGIFRCPMMLYFAVDPNTGHLYAVYFDTTSIVDGNRNLDLYFTKSTNQGTSWTTPVIINSDNNPPGDQFWPWIEVDREGRIHISFYDTRHTVQDDGVTNGMFDVYYMYSEDAGDSWSEHRLTPDPWNSADDGILGNSQFLGDYMGMALAKNRLYPVYIDTSGGSSQLFTNVISFPVEAALDDFSIVRGTLLSGDLASLTDSDDQRMRIQSDFGFSALEPNDTDLEVTGTLDGIIDELRVTIESQVNHPTGTAKVRAFDHDANQFVSLGEYAVNFGDATETVTAANAARFVGPNGEVIVRTKHVVVATFAATGFISQYDLVAIEGQ